MRHPKAVTEAIRELEEKTLDDIQVETARKWLARACAAKVMGLEDDAHEYAHEALEHAALAQSETLIDEVRAELARYGAKGN